MEELLAYSQNCYRSRAYEKMTFPLQDEAFVSAWQKYRRQSELRGVAEVLKDKLVQLDFPIRKGISESKAYRDATRRGLRTRDKRKGLALREPGTMRLFFVSSPAGRLPVLLIRNRADFVSLVRALAFRNEPEEIPESMGSLIVSGYNNWDRVRCYRERWQAGHPGEDWEEEFPVFTGQKKLFQDKFIVLSGSPYSAVEAGSLGLEEGEWSELSFQIRTGHELGHYFCKRVLVSMKSNLLDELLADYLGLIRACGRYRSDWLLRFMGLEGNGECRKGGRAENYARQLSRPAFAVICRLLRAAILNLARLEVRVKRGTYEPWKVVTAMSFFTLEELAAAEAPRRLAGKYAEVEQHWRMRS